MAKKKILTKNSKIIKPKATIQQTNENLMNALGPGTGFPGNNFLNPFVGFGQFGSGAPPAGYGQYEQVEDAATVFNGLRWYMISNFRQVLSQAFAELGLVQTIVSVPVDDALKGGIMIKSKELDEEEIKDLQLAFDRDGDLETAGWAGKWNRLYGGAGILILLDDQDPEEPMDISRITEKSNLEFRDVDMWELFWDRQNTEGYDPQTQTQEFEHYDYYAEKIHKSRVMRMKGIKAPSFIRPRLRGWGVSVVETFVRSLNQYLKATDLSFEVLDEFKIDVYKIQNLASTLLTPDGGAAVNNRIQMANWQKNYQNALVMDKEDEWDHKQLQFAGLAETMAQIRMQVAADMRMPIIKLFGQSVSTGLGSSAQEEMENYNSMIESEVRGKLKYHILQMLQLKCQSLFGYIPDDLEIEFKPLRELSGVDQETVKREKFARLQAAQAAGLITTEEFRDASNKGNLFDVQLDTTDDAINELESDMDEAEEFAGEEAGKDKTGEEGSNREDTRRVKPVKNSPEFDKASFEADGGEAWTSQQRVKALTQLDHVIKNPLWVRALEASRASFGSVNESFALWWFKKQGGRL